MLLKPKMIEVNSLIEHVRRDAKRDTNDSAIAMQRLNALLKEKWGLAYRIESLHPTQPVPGEADTASREK